MSRFIENKVSTYLGLIFIAFGFVVFFVPTQFDLSWWFPFILWIFGILLINAEDKLIDVLTLGLSRFLIDIRTHIKK